VSILAALLDELAGDPEALDRLRGISKQTGGRRGNDPAHDPSRSNPE
jgi:hypothetical protein